MGIRLVHLHHDWRISNHTSQDICYQVQVPSAESQAAFEIAASLMVDADRPDAAAKDAQSASILTAVYHQANTTLAALRQTAAALEAVERAAAAVEQAKGRNDDTVRS